MFFPQICLRWFFFGNYSKSPRHNYETSISAVLYVGTRISSIWNRELCSRKRLTVRVLNLTSVETLILRIQRLVTRELNACPCKIMDSVVEDELRRARGCDVSKTVIDSLARAWCVEIKIVIHAYRFSTSLTSEKLEGGGRRTKCCGISGLIQYSKVKYESNSQAQTCWWGPSRCVACTSPFASQEGPCWADNWACSQITIIIAIAFLFITLIYLHRIHL